MVIDLDQHWYRWRPVACLAQSHHLKQRWLVVNLTPTNKLPRKLNKKYIQEHTTENVVCKMVAILFGPPFANSILLSLGLVVHISVLCQKQVWRAGTSNYIPQILWDVITCSWPSYLLLAQHSSYVRVCVCRLELNSENDLKPSWHQRKYRKISNVRRILVGNKIVDHSDVVGASPVGAARTTSSFSISQLALIYCAKATARRDEKRIHFRIWCVLY